jgi:hypothetical protein
VAKALKMRRTGETARSIAAYCGSVFICNNALEMSDEIALLEMLLARARKGAGVTHEAILEEIAVGDVVQLRPGADPHWETSLLLVCRIHPNDGGIQGQILRPHRGGYREAWYTYRSPSVARIGRMPFPEPDIRVRSWSYDGPTCPTCGLPAVHKPEKQEFVRKPPTKQEKYPIVRRKRRA